MLRKQITKQDELLRTRKTRKKGKRIALKGRFVFSTKEVLQIAKEAEAETAANKSRKQRRQRSTSVEIEDTIKIIPENESSDSESDCIVVATKKLS